MGETAGSNVPLEMKEDVLFIVTLETNEPHPRALASKTVQTLPLKLESPELLPGRTMSTWLFGPLLKMNELVTGELVVPVVRNPR